MNITIGKFDSQKSSEDDKPDYYKDHAETKYFSSDFRLYDPYFTREGKDDPTVTPDFLRINTNT